MASPPDDIKILITKFLDGSATEMEKKSLHDWYDAVNSGDTESVWVEEPVKNEAYGLEMLAEIRARIGHRSVWAVVRAFNWRRVAAAAVLVLALGGIIYYYHDRDRGAMISPSVGATDVPAPKVARAVITLGSGKQVFLDSSGKGELAREEGVQVRKLEDGQVIYAGARGVGDAGGEGRGDDVGKDGRDATGRGGAMVYNTLTVPRGSKVVDLVLQDGTHVWLNAASSLRYPVRFSGKERNVEIRGEGYFEVARNAKQAFTVTILGGTGAGTKVAVLGTSFNINAYEDEPVMRTTLAAGSVRAAGVLLQPGQQVKVVGEGKAPGVEAVDLEQVVAWKNGLFQFQQNRIEDIMRQLSRWYDVEVRYDASISQHYTGKIYRSSDISQVLKMLELIGGVHFTIEGKKIIVMQ